MQIKQKKYKVQYEYVSKDNFNEKKKYVILDPSKNNSIISLNRLKNDGIDTNKISFKPVYLTQDVKILTKLELNLLIGKEKIEKKILIMISEELNDQFYLGNDFLSFYSISENDKTTRYNLIQLGQEIEIEEILDENDDIFGEEIQDIMNENDIINEENIPIGNQWLKLNFKNIFIIIISLIIAMFAVKYQYILNFKSPATDLSSTNLSPERFECNFDEKSDESEKLEEIEQESNSFEILPVIRDITVECFNTICDCPESKEETKEKNIKKKSTKKPTKQSTKKSTKKPTKQSTKQSEKKPTKQSTKKPMKQSTKKPTKQSTKQSEKKPTKKSTKKPAKRSTKRSTKRSMKRSMKNKSKKQRRILQIMRKFIRYR